MSSGRWSSSRRAGDGTTAARVVHSGTRRGNTELLVCGWLVLEPPRYMVMALWTVYEVACFIVSLDDIVPVMQCKFQQFVPSDSGCLTFSSSTSAGHYTCDAETSTHS